MWLCVMRKVHLAVMNLLRLLSLLQLYSVSSFSLFWVVVLVSKLANFALINSVSSGNRQLFSVKHFIMLPAQKR